MKKKKTKKKTAVKQIKKQLRRIVRAVKAAVVAILAFPMTSAGYLTDEAHQWVHQVYGALIKGRRYPLGKTLWALKRGFTPQQVEQLGVTKENYRDMISCKDYAYLRPISGIYSKWIADIVSIHTIFKPFRPVMPTCYYQIGKRDGKTQIIPLYDRNAGDRIADILQLLREKGSLKIKGANQHGTWTAAWREGKFYLDGKRIKRPELEKRLKTFNNTVVVTEDVVAARAFVGGRLRLVVFNEQGDDPMIGDATIRFHRVKKRVSDVEEIAAELTPEMKALRKNILYYRVDRSTGAMTLAEKCADMPRLNPTTLKDLPTEIPCWPQIRETVDRLCRFAPQLEYFGMDITITEDGFKITRITNHPGYPGVVPFSAETTAYLKKKYEQKKKSFTFARRIENAWKRVRRWFRVQFARLFFPRTLLPYIAVRVIQDQWKDFTTNKDTTFKEKLWAVKHGFISYRLHQYGITEENWHNYISDFEYKWLRHINPKYRHWMEDKITVKYVCSEYNHLFPEYYYHISPKNGNNKVISMMDCPEGYSNTYEDIFRLVREKGVLALKPDEGSHGNGFYRFDYADGKYYLNYEEVERQQVLDILQDVKNQYLVTEYIVMHDELKRIYDGAVNTIRMIVFKKDGKTPVIGNAYMRFGSRRTGAVDNMGAGGMYARVDIDTGRFYDSKIIEANEIKSCLYHPDTQVKIEGYLPNWEQVKQDILEVARSIPQMEYFGFDLALTPTGLKFPEINRFPDYPAIEKFSPATMDYLLYKLSVKKKQYGYHKSRGKTLVKLPKR